MFRRKTNAESQLLLWPYWVERGVFQEIVDVVVVDLDVGDKDAVTTVFVHVLRFARLRRADHVGKFWVGLLPAGRKDDKQQINKNSRQNRLILLDWKPTRPPSYNRWVKEVLHKLKLEKLRSSLNGSTKKFYDPWFPFLKFVDSPDILLGVEDD